MELKGIVNMDYYLSQCTLYFKQRSGKGQGKVREVYFESGKIDIWKESQIKLK